MDCRPAAPGKANPTSSSPPADELKANFKTDDGNQYQNIVRGRAYMQILNGRLVSVTVDGDDSKCKDKGLIGLQIEGAPLKVMSRDTWLKTQ